MYATRNAITIGLLWLILSTIGFLWIKSESRETQELKSKNKQLSQMLDGSLEVAQKLSATEAKFRFLNQRWSEAPKIMLSVEEPSFSLYYLNWLIDNYDLSLEFDFVLNNMGTANDISTFTFTLTGEGSYQDIYNLIFFLSRNPLLYQIESFSINQNKDNTALLDFKMQIKGFSLSPNWEMQHEFNFSNIKPAVQTAVFHNVFESLRKPQMVTRSNDMFRAVAEKPKSIERTDNLLNVEQTTLQAVTTNKVYLKDKTGKLITLKVGDKVHLGNLEKINQKKSEVEFIIEQGGVTKKVTLGLGYIK